MATRTLKTKLLLKIEQELCSMNKVLVQWQPKVVFELLACEHSDLFTMGLMYYVVNVLINVVFYVYFYFYFHYF